MSFASCTFMRVSTTQLDGNHPRDDFGLSPQLKRAISPLHIPFCIRSSANNANRLLFNLQFSMVLKSIGQEKIVCPLLTF